MELEDIYDLVESRKSNPDSDRKTTIVAIISVFAAIVVTVLLIFISRISYYKDYIGVFLNEHGPDFYKFGIYSFDHSFDGEMDVYVDGVNTNHNKGLYYSVRDNVLCLNGTNGEVTQKIELVKKDGNTYIYTYNDDGQKENTYKKMKN